MVGAHFELPLTSSRLRSEVVAVCVHAEPHHCPLPQASSVKAASHIVLSYRVASPHSHKRIMTASYSTLPKLFFALFHSHSNAITVYSISNNLATSFLPNEKQLHHASDIKSNEGEHRFAWYGGGGGCVCVCVCEERVCGAGTQRHR